MLISAGGATLCFMIKPVSLFVCPSRQLVCCVVSPTTSPETICIYIYIYIVQDNSNTACRSIKNARRNHVNSFGLQEERQQKLDCMH